MKPSALLLPVLCVGLIGPLFAGETYRLESVLYVFREADFAQVQLNTAAVAAAGRGESFTSPASLAFDRHTLELSGAQYRWDGAGEPAPAQFSPVAVPVMVVKAAQQASVYCAVPMQYMEKAADGGLQVRQLDRAAADAPHYQLTFAVRPAERANRLAVACQLQLAVVAGREKIPGVELDVGRPVLTRVEESFQFLSQVGEWSGLVLRKPGGGDYGLLLLLKIGVVPDPGVVTAPMPGGLMTAEQLDRFATSYYRQPRPDRIAAAIEALDSSGFLEPGVGLDSIRPSGRFWTFVGFFAEVFAANPERVEEWQKLGKKQQWVTRDCLQAAAKFSPPGAILAVKGSWIVRPGAIFSLGDSWGIANDARWGAFFASGNPAYLRQFVAQLREIDPLRGSGDGLGAMWSLARNAPAHPLIRTTLEEARAAADPRTRGFLDDLLTKDLGAIRQEIAGLIPVGASPASYYGGQGMRDAGDFGPVNPGQEIHPK